MANKARSQKMNYKTDIGLPKSVIQTLPNKVINIILNLLPLHDVLAFSATCHSFRNIICSKTNNHLWHNLMKRECLEAALPIELSSMDSYKSFHAMYRSFVGQEHKLATQIDNLKDQLQKSASVLEHKENELQTKNTRLQCMLTSDMGSLNETEEHALYMLSKCKLSASKDGFVYSLRKRGRPQRFLHLPITECSSSKAASRTVRQRSKLLENVIEKVSGGSNGGSPGLPIDKDKIAQQASLIRQQKELFVESTKEAGLKIVTRFNLKDIAALKAELPLEQIRLLKRAFSHTFGFDVFGSEKKLREYVGSLKMPPEGGTVPVTDQNGEQINVSLV